MNICLFNPDEWGRPLPADDERADHIRSILKLRSGDELRVGLVGVGLGTARIADEPGSGTSRSGPLSLEFPDVESLIPRAGASLTLIIGHPRPPVFQRLLRDLSSMGVEAVYWVRSELSEKSYLSSRAWQPDQLDRHVRLGLQQGGYSSPPVIKKYYSLHACLAELSATTGFGTEPGGNAAPAARLLLHNGDEAAPSLYARLGHISASERVILAIGPERGWTDGEVSQLADRGFLLTGLGSAVLRTETAAVISAGMVSIAVGERDAAKSPGSAGR
jgi:16S rRNA (uracil1498-N3)-methyltransferase